MELRKYILTENDCYKSNRQIKPIGIMVHSTGANNPNLRRYINPDDGFLGVNSYGNHWNQPNVKKCVHAMIGRDKEGKVKIYQTLPWNWRGWHAASGLSGSANNTHISFEILEDDLQNKYYFENVYTAAVELCAYLCKLYDLKVSNVIGHYEGALFGIASNHVDPSHWFKLYGKSMDIMRQDIAKLLETEQEDTMNKVNVKLNGINHDAYLIDGRPYVLLRPFGEALGAKVDWFGEEQGAVITPAKPQVVEVPDIVSREKIANFVKALNALQD